MTYSCLQMSYKEPTNQPEPDIYASEDTEGTNLLILSY